jgi:microcystin-dependent protein
MSIFGAGYEVVTSTTRPSSPITGQMIYETDTASFRWYTGTSWAGMIPVGTTQSFAGSTAPIGWLLCYGQTLNAVTNPIYADLFSVIGTTYGGSGNTAFSVPDLRGRAPHGKDDMGGSAANRITSGVSGITGTTLGASGGSEAMHQHTHTQNAHNHAPNQGTGFVTTNGSVVGSTAGSAGYLYAYQPSTTASTTATNQNTGTGNSQNMPPTIITNFIIKY